MHYDWIGYGIGVVGIICTFVIERRAKRRRDEMHSFLVALKPSIQGTNKERIIAAINDMLEKLK